jgi:hypothetical protein
MRLRSLKPAVGCSKKSVERGREPFGNPKGLRVDKDTNEDPMPDPTHGLDFGRKSNQPSREEA